jgi:quercetin dioxygenase-like cupin family protein
MHAGDMLLLNTGEAHSLEALDDASIIVTIHLAHANQSRSEPAGQSSIGL